MHLHDRENQGRWRFTKSSAWTAEYRELRSKQKRFAYFSDVEITEQLT